jgi:hypothetical protein
MTILSVEVADDVLQRAERRAAAMGTSIQNEVTDLIDRLGSDSDDELLAAARLRMQELFRTVSGFRGATKIPREELYDRGRLH